MQPVVIIGGGISGLSTAYYLSKLSKLNNSIGKIILIESSNRFGGWVNTLRNEKNGVLHEYGPRSLRKAGLAGQNTIELLNNLGIGDQVLVKSSKNPVTKSNLQKYVASSDELINLKFPPNKISELLFKQKPLKKSLLRCIIKELKTPKLELTNQSLDNLDDEEKQIINKNLELLNEQLDDISVYDFVKLRLGDDLADWLVDPLLRGISSGDARTLSVRSMFVDMFESERKSGSLIRNQLEKMKSAKNDKLNQIKSNVNEANSNLHEKLKVIDDFSIWSFKNGMVELPNSLINYLKNDEKIELRNNNKLLNFKTDPIDNKLNLTIENEKNESYEIKAEHVFFSLNANDLAKLIPDEEKNLNLIKSTLNSIRSVSVATINLEFNRKGILDKTPGFGFLIPSHVNSSVLGVVFDSCVFPELDNSNEITRLSVMCGGDWFNELCKENGKLDESKLVERSMKVLNKYLGIKEDPSFMKTNSLTNCIPQYRVGHYLKLKLIKNEIEKQNCRFSLVGSSYSGISLNDCIYNSKLKAGELLLNYDDS